MASRKDTKEQARAARIAAEQAHIASAAKTKRFQLIGAIVAVVVIVLVVAIAISSGGSSPSGPLKGKQAQQTVAQVDSLLAGIPQSGTTLGNPKAKVTFYYFGDLQCPICRDFTLSSLPQFISGPIKSGQAKMTYRSFCTATCNNPNSGDTGFRTQQVAAYAAGKQNKFWNYAELFYHEQGTEGSAYVNDTFLQTLATQAAIDVNKWKTDRGDPSLLSQVQSDGNDAAKDQLSGTPAIIASGPKGQEVVKGATGIPSSSELAAAITAVS